MWTFEQTTGKWFDPSGVYVSTGYSGHGIGLNNHALEREHDIGPLPVGVYDQSEWFDHPKLGPVVCHLLPRTYVYNRTGFMNHGDNKESNHTASDGCAIADHKTRLAREKSNDQVLQCVEIFNRPSVSK